MDNRIMIDYKIIIQNIFFEMIKENDLAGIKAAIQNDPLLVELEVDSDNFTLLHRAASLNLTDMIKLLLSFKANVNAINNFNRQPLFYAIINRPKSSTDLSAIEALIDAKADLNYGPEYAVPLNVANSNQQKIDIVKLLLKAGAKRGANEVFAAAVMDGNQELVDILIAKKFSVNSADYENKSLLMWAARKFSDHRHYQIAEKLLLLKADINAKGHYGNTALYWAISSQDKLAKLYLDHGATLDTQNDEGISPLMHAAKYGELSMIKLLCTRVSTTDIAKKSFDGSTLLHYAAQNSRKEVCQYFINKGLDLNAINDEGWTPLHGACLNYHCENVSALLKAGAKANVRTWDGETPLSLLKNYHERYDFNDKKNKEVDILISLVEDSCKKQSIPIKASSSVTSNNLFQQGMVMNHNEFKIPVWRKK